MDDAVLMERLAHARTLLAGVAHRTPVVTSATLDARVGARVFLKCENLQRMGAFKFRGAYQLIASLPEAQRARGVAAYSSGNHAQAVALVAQRFGIPAVIVMPSTAPGVKLDAVRGYGAEVLHHDALGESREELAARVAAERGMTLVPPFDHPDIIAGQGTAAAELFEDAGPLDALLVPVGGGGLVSGCAIAAIAAGGATRVIGVEPAAGDDGCRSFRSGRLERVEAPDTIADGARTPSLGVLTFEVIRRHVHDMVSVEDVSLITAMRFALERLKLVVEPTGALALAALLDRTVDPGQGRVGVLLSGGNVDSSRLAAWMVAAHGSRG